MTREQSLAIARRSPPLAIEQSLAIARPRLPTLSLAEVVLRRNFLHKIFTSYCVGPQI